MTNIQLVLKVGKFQDQSMALEVYANDRLIFAKDQFETPKVDLSFEIDLPCKIEFRTSGKQKFDTEVDVNGVILQDKYILVEGIAIDNIWIKKWVLESKLFSPISTNYFGQNDVYWLEISHTDIMDFWLDLLTHD